MPIYDYLCKRCGETFERQVSGPRARAACPACRSRATQRQPSLVRVRGSSPYAPTFRTGDDHCAPTG